MQRRTRSPSYVSGEVNGTGMDLEGERAWRPVPRFARSTLRPFHASPVPRVARSTGSVFQGWAV